MAVPTMLETSRTHTVVGSFGNQGGAITAITNANPTVLSTTSAHGLIAGDPIQVSGVTTDTGANGNYTVTSIQTTLQFTYPGIGNGAASFGSATLTQALAISGVTTDWTVRLRVESLTAAKKCVILLQDSLDGFVADIVTRAAYNVQGEVKVGAMLDCIEARKYNVPGMRFGTALATMRLYVAQIDAAATLVCSCWFES